MHALRRLHVPEIRSRIRRSLSLNEVGALPYLMNKILFIPMSNGPRSPHPPTRPCRPPRASVPGLAEGAVLAVSTSAGVQVLRPSPELEGERREPDAPTQVTLPVPGTEQAPSQVRAAQRPFQRPQRAGSSPAPPVFHSTQCIAAETTEKVRRYRSRQRTTLGWRTCPVRHPFADQDWQNGRSGCQRTGSGAGGRR